MTGPDRPRSREWAMLIALMGGYAAIFAAYYPPLAGIEDEVGFINQALVWSRGAVSAEGAGYEDLADFGLIRGRHVAFRHPGRSLAALPFLLAGGPKAVFASGLAVHLATAAVGAILLSRLGKSPAWAGLLLLHPTLAIYSRTIMADATAGLGLLLAGLFLTVRGRRGAIGAGLSVGSAALMRYHAGLALPLVAAMIALDRGRPRRWRDALLCLAAGAAAGALIVAYNLTLYGTVLDPFTSKRGFFAARFLLPHTLFYASALMAIWPLMLVAPFLDGSRLRWLVRGVCGFFLVTATFYYFHDRGKNWLETAVVGQRLIQVALPLWVVSYAVVLDDRVVGPLRGRLRDGGRAILSATLVSSSCVGLLMVGMIFDKHQQHLNRLLAAREALIIAVPPGSLVVDHGPLRKLFGVPSGVPGYRWLGLSFQDDPLVKPGDARLGREKSPWYLAILRTDDGALPPGPASALIDHYRMTPVPSRDVRLALYRSGGGTPRD